jgi:hypothetical protein
MILKLLVSGLLVVGGFFAVNTPATQDAQDAEKMKEMMAMYEKAAQPGDQHKGLQTLVGKWDQKCEFTMGGPSPTVSSGTAEYRSLHDGRFVIGENNTKMMMPDATGKMTERPFTGFNLLGYDNVLKQYQSCWCDSMGTGIFWSTGTPDASGKVITYEGSMKDAMTPQGRPWKMVINLESNDKHVIELWDAMDGKTLQKMGVITETRKK